MVTIVSAEPNPPDAIVSSQAYRPDPHIAAASMNAVRTLDRYRPGDMLQSPDETRSIVPMRRDQIGPFSSKLIADTIHQVEGDVTRAITTSTGFTPYVLETPAKVIFPVQAPMVQLTPRMVGKGTDIEHWKSVLSIFNQGGPFSQSHWGGTSDGSTTLDSPVYVLNSYQSTYQTIAQYNSVTFQSQWRSRALEGDMLARRKVELVYAEKLQEENWIINGASKLWRPAKPLLTATLTGGNLAATTTFWVQITAVNAGGESLPSAIASVTTGATGGSGAITITFAGVIGATSYNVYIGTGSTQPSNANMFICVTADITGGLPQQPADYIGSMSVVAVLVTNPTTGAHPPTSNTATVATNVFDGMISLCYLNPNTGGNISVGEQGMTSVIVQPAAATGLLALQDIQLLFRKMFSQAMADPSHLFVSPIEAVTIDNLVGTASNFRILAEPQSAGGIANLVAGQKVTHILNQVTGTTVQVVTLPYLPQGTMVAASFSIPFPAPDVQDPPFRMMINQDYTSVDYPPAQGAPQTWAFGIFVDEALVNQYLGGWGLLEAIQPAAGV